MGPDKISPPMLSMCEHELTGPQTKLFQNCMLQKNLPKIWKTAEATAVYKKGDIFSVKNYRK